MHFESILSTVFFTKTLSRVYIPFLNFYNNNWKQWKHSTDGWLGGARLPRLPICEIIGNNRQLWQLFLHFRIDNHK